MNLKAHIFIRWFYIKMKILNCTPHEICLYNENDIINKGERYLHVAEGTQPEIVIKPSGTVATAQMELGGTRQNRKRIWTNVNDLPEGYDIYIVSAQCALAAKDLGRDISKFRTIVGAIKDLNDRKTIGCYDLAEI